MISSAFRLLLCCSFLHMFVSVSFSQSEPCDCSDGTPTTEAQLLAGGSFCGDTSIDVGATFNPVNEICWSGGTLTLTGNDADVNIGGIFQVTGGTVDLDFDSNQDVDILSGGNLIVGAGATFFANDQIDVASGGEMNVYGTVFSNTQEITVANGGTINVYAGGTLTAGNNDEITVGGTMNVWGTVTANNTSFVTGTMTIYSTGAVNINNGGDFTVDGGTVTANGDLNIADDLEIYNGGYVSVLGPNGNATIGDDVEVVGGSTLYVSQNGVIDVGDNMYNATADNGGGAATGTIIIDGTANVINDVVIYDTTPDSGLSGSGTINLTNGTITDNEGANNFICSGSPASCTGGNTPLPVELIAFEYELHGISVHLKWTTASELNNLGFYVEKSFDGTTFDDLSFVQGNGTTNAKNEYKYIDHSNRKGYYRLRQVDFDGAVDYSKLLFVPDSEIALQLGVFPNPTTGKVTLSQGLTNYALYSLSGMLILSNQHATTAMAQEELSQTLEKADIGTYILMTVTNGQTQTIKILKH